ncbi:MAG: UxaA family hydrolase [Solobacterium sp.]|nr:UxaA family hydrolase [Solobacterium sp.]
MIFRKGTELQTVKAEENIPYCHKIALTDLPAGSDVVKYGELIGRTTEDVKKGHWVSDRNILSVPRDYESEMIPLEADGSVSEAAKEQYTWGGNPGEGLSADEILKGLNVVRDPETGRMQFWGYKRKEGRAGIRNHVLILPTCACGSESSRIVASQVRGAVNIVFNTGCSDVAANTAMSQKVLTGFALNPNVYGVVIIGLGCETVGHRQLREKIQAQTSKPVVSFGIQEEAAPSRQLKRQSGQPGKWLRQPACSRRNSAISPSSCWALNAAAPTQPAASLPTRLSVNAPTCWWTSGHPRFSANPSNGSAANISLPAGQQPRNCTTR